MSGVHAAARRHVQVQARRPPAAASRAVPFHRVAAWSAVALLLALTVAMVSWRLHGGRWVRVETASMGTEAPVGTLLWVAPADFTALKVGDLITFRPPGTNATYSHLVHARNADGTISTKGRITAPDPWRLGPQDVIGRVVWTVPGVGWIVLAAPLLVCGGILVWLVARRVRDRDLRLPVTVVGVALVVAAALAVYRPLTQAQQLSFVPVADGARATYVSTGLLPLQLSAAGDSVVLRDGQTGSVLARKGSQDAASGHHRFAVNLRPAIPLVWWLVLVGACFLPAAARWVLALRRRALA